MAQGRRDEFSLGTKRTLAERVGYCCSNPDCRRKTVGPNSDPMKSASIGEAAHIRAAAPKGPRYDASMTPEERASVENGIWLCRNCARLIDVDSNKYTIELLEQWKQQAEQNAEEEISTREGKKDLHIDELIDRQQSDSQESTMPTYSEPHYFKIAFTFTGKYRERIIEPVCDELLKLGYSKDDIFFDKWHSHRFNGAKGSSKLQSIYNKQCDCVVVLLSPDYKDKKWTGKIEWPSIVDLIINDKDDNICLLGIDDVNIGEIEGLYEYQAIYEPVDDKDPKEIAEFIHKKYTCLISEGASNHRIDEKKESVPNLQKLEKLEDTSEPKNDEKTEITPEPNKDEKPSKKNIKTHSATAVKDRATISTLTYFLNSKEINCDFSDTDSRPNTDGYFEFVRDPSKSQAPNKRFAVQIKGTDYKEGAGVVKYKLKKLEFPEYIKNKVTEDPGILFVVFNPEKRRQARVFWKYMSPEFLESIDFKKKSKTIYFSPEEEIKNTDESRAAFCARLCEIIDGQQSDNQASTIELKKDWFIRISDRVRSLSISARTWIALALVAIALGSLIYYRVGILPYRWSKWVDELPEKVTRDKDNYEVDEQKLYSSRRLEKTISNETDFMEGWELYYTAENGAYGPWSDWSLTKVSESDTREVEDQLRYHYKDKETTASNSPTMSGWELEYSSTYWKPAEPWRDWSETEVTESDCRKVEIETRYRYRDKQSRTSMSKGLENEGWTLIDSKEEWVYGTPSKWSETRVDESDTIHVETKTQYSYREKIRTSSFESSLDGWTEYGSRTELNDDMWTDWSETFIKDTDSVEVETKEEKIELEDGTEITITLYRSRPIIIHLYWKWGSWSDYSDDAVTKTEDRDVKTRTLYSYCTKNLRTTYYYSHETDWSDWSTEEVSESDTREVEQEPFYRYQAGVNVTIYHFYRWTDWSDWSDTEVKETETRKVRSATFYRYRDMVFETTYYFRRWTDWTEYSEEKVDESDDVEVQTMTQYRYRKKESGGEAT